MSQIIPAASLPMSGTVQLVTAFGAVATPIVIAWLANREKIRSAEISLKVEQVKLAAIEAAQEVKLAAIEAAREVKLAAIEAARKVEDKLDAVSAESSAKLDELGRISHESLDVSHESLDVSNRALKVGNGALTRSLRREAELARWKADNSEDHPDAERFRREAELAELALAEHAKLNETING